MAYSVSQRRNEIGLRMALGAEAGTVRWMVLGQGGRLLAVGLSVGLVAALALSRLLAGLVVGVSATDPLTFTAMPALLALVALVANLIPARRATKMDPASTLRAE
jgi:ABC-type antimicrobial peptide transport system permease subunit